MEPLTKHAGVAVSLKRDNVDTDIIIPSREMKKVSKKGLGQGLFANLRYLPDSRQPNPDFSLNDAARRGASILLSGRNFGCGSSREHAVWALSEYGIRVIIAESFGAIFYDNCIANGLLPIALPHDAIDRIAQWTDEAPQQQRPQIDLENLTISAGGFEASFEIEDEKRRRLLGGLSSIDVTLERLLDIEKFQADDRLLRPWIHSNGEA
jgi:3-isopropylmalate/(R)-2-methylmalate dehydratase small subunit